MGLPEELSQYAENLWRRFPEVFLSLGSPHFEEYFEPRKDGCWRVMDTEAAKVIEIRLPRRSAHWEGNAQLPDGQSDPSEADFVDEDVLAAVDDIRQRIASLDGWVAEHVQREINMHFSNVGGLMEALMVNTRQSSRSFSKGTSDISSEYDATPPLSADASWCQQRQQRQPAEPQPSSSPQPPVSVEHRHQQSPPPPLGFWRQQPGSHEPEQTPPPSWRTLPSHEQQPQQQQQPPLLASGLQLPVSQAQKKPPPPLACCRPPSISHEQHQQQQPPLLTAWRQLSVGQEQEQLPAPSTCWSPLSFGHEQHHKQPPPRSSWRQLPVSQEGEQQQQHQQQQQPPPPLAFWRQSPVNQAQPRPPPMVAPTNHASSQLALRRGFALSKVQTKGLGKETPERAIRKPELDRVAGYVLTQRSVADSTESMVTSSDASGGCSSWAGSLQC